MIRGSLSSVEPCCFLLVIRLHPVFTYHLRRITVCLQIIIAILEFGTLEALDNYYILREPSVKIAQRHCDDV